MSYMGVLLSAVFIFVLSAPASVDSLTVNVRDGDIIFHTSTSSQSMAIQRATGSQYSHMGIIFFQKGEPYVYEAVKTVQFTPLKKWIAGGEGMHYVVRRLKDADRLLTETAIKKLRREARRLQGKPYDLTFEWSDDRIYCSELAWKIYDRAMSVRIGRLQKLREFDLSDPAVKQKMKERYGSKAPMEEPVISPGEMFEAANLVTVVQNETL